MTTKLPRNHTYSDPDRETPADVGRRLVEIHVRLGQIEGEADALRRESGRLGRLLVTALPPGECVTRRLVVECYRDGTNERREPHLIEVAREDGELYVEVTKLDRWSDLAWPELEVGSNAALIAAAGDYRPTAAADVDLIDSETA